MNIRASVFSREHHGNPDSGNRPSVLAVVGQVEPLITMASQEPDPLASFTAAMADEWGSKLISEAPGPYYEYVWNPVTEHWDRICINGARFEIAYAAGDTVVVSFAAEQLLGT